MKEDRTDNVVVEPKYYTNKKKYISEFNKGKCKGYSIRCHKVHDKDIIDFLDSIENKQGLIKELVRAEMIRRGS